MQVKNPLYDENGQFMWEKFFSVFGIVFSLVAFLVAGSVSETIVAGTFAIGGSFGFAFVTVMIYGFVCGFSVIPLTIISACGGENPHIMNAIVVGLVVGIVIVFITGYTPPFRTVFWNWVCSREKPGQKRVM